ncbi:hypothetical protein [Flagellimonas sp.]|uniref:hypothetical protein n=1 Tax=Flagellimonas sp. TaxID=2058762 RepID=UPI003B5236C8
MKSYGIVLFLVLGISSYSTETEQLVRNYLQASNNYNFEGAFQFLDSDYQEVFIDESVEIENLNQLKDFMAWRKIMNSKSNLLSLKSSKDTVTTVEQTYHFMDSILERKPRTFKIKYVVKDDKILKSILDTMPGHSETARFNYAKFAKFQEFCNSEEIKLDMGMTASGALQLKRALEQYKSRC